MSKSIRKILVVGTSGCGKTTLAKYLSKILSIENVDLDDHFWLPGWKKRDDDEFFQIIKRKVSEDSWVISGNYSRAKEITWSRADLIIWIDLPLRVCLWRSFKRSLIRLITREPCCNGNFETIGRLFGKESILLWIIRTHSRRKKAYSKLFENNKLLHLKSVKDVSDFYKKEGSFYEVMERPSSI